MSFLSDLRTNARQSNPNIDTAGYFYKPSRQKPTIAPAPSLLNFAGGLLSTPIAAGKQHVSNIVNAPNLKGALNEAFNPLEVMGSYGEGIGKGLMGQELPKTYDITKTLTNRLAPKLGLNQLNPAEEALLKGYGELGDFGASMVGPLGGTSAFQIPQTLWKGGKALLGGFKNMKAAKELGTAAMKETLKKTTSTSGGIKIAVPELVSKYGKYIYGTTNLSTKEIAMLPTKTQGVYLKSAAIPTTVAAKEAGEATSKIAMTAAKNMTPDVDDAIKQIWKQIEVASKNVGKQKELVAKNIGRQASMSTKALASGKTGQAAFSAARGALAGKAGRVSFEPVKLAQEKLDVVFDYLRNTLYDGTFRGTTQFIRAGDGLSQILAGHIPNDSTMAILKTVMPKDFMGVVSANRSFLQKANYFGLQAVNTMRSLMTTIDVSASFRQTLPALFLNPKRWAEGFVKQFEAMGSQNAYDDIMNSIYKSKNFELADKAGLKLTGMGTDLAAREEVHFGNWVERIPLLGKPIRGSSRAYSMMTNYTRYWAFNDMVEKAIASGQNLNSLNKWTGKTLAQEMANLANIATGRASLGALEGAAKELTYVFFAPRLWMSRLQMLNPLYYLRAAPFVRKQALKSLFGLSGSVATVLALAKIAGASVETNPNSADFAKIRIKDTRIDLLGGFQQNIRMISQLLTGKYISSTTGKEITLGEGYGKPTRADILFRQLESKSSPLVGLITNLLKQNNPDGTPIDIPAEVGSRFVPLVLSDIKDLAESNPELLPLELLAELGFGVQTYSGKPQNKPTTSGSMGSLGSVGINDRFVPRPYAPRGYQKGQMPVFTTPTPKPIKTKSSGRGKKTKQPVRMNIAPPPLKINR